MSNKNHTDIFTFEFCDDLIEYMNFRISQEAPSFVFGDYASYQFLFDEKIIIPGKTILRIDDGTVGGHYTVLSRTDVEGVDGEAYAGKEGIHSVEDLIVDTPHWEPGAVFFPQAKLGRPYMMLTEVYTTLDMLEIYCGIGKDQKETKEYLASLK